MPVEQKGTASFGSIDTQNLLWLYLFSMLLFKEIHEV